MSDKVTDIGTAAERRATTRMLHSAQGLVTLAKVAPRRLAAMADAARGMKGSRAADAPPIDLPHWCEDHERTVRECWDDGARCTGVPDLRHTDPTGEAAVSGDRARADHRRALQLLDRIDGARHELEDLFARYTPAKTRTPGAKARRDLADENAAPLRYDPLLHCRLCIEVDAPHGSGPNIVAMHRMTTVGDILPEPMPLCRPHIGAIGLLRRVTTVAETERHRDTGRWVDTQKGKSA